MKGHHWTRRSKFSKEGPPPCDFPPAYDTDSSTIKDEEILRGTAIGVMVFCQKCDRGRGLHLFLLLVRYCGQTPDPNEPQILLNAKVEAEKSATKHILAHPTGHSLRIINLASSQSE